MVEQPVVEQQHPHGVPRPLLDLTDEEVAVLFGTDGGVIALPYLEALPAPARAIVVHTAYRSLLARGLLMSPPDQGRPGVEAEPDLHLGLELDARVADIVDLRDGAPVLLCLHRQLADDRVLRYAHVVDDFALVEDVLPTGLHRFGWLERDALAACLQAFLVPDDIADIPAGEREGTGPTTDLLGRSVVSVDATVRRIDDDGPGVLLGLFIGPDGTWVGRNVFGAPGAPTFEPVAASTVGALVEQLVAAAEHDFVTSSSGRPDNPACHADRHLSDRRRTMGG